MDRNQKKTNWIPLIIVACGFTVFRLCLSFGMLIQFAPGSGYDDQMQISKAITIANGMWLGDFGPMTLVKGVGYPLLTAFFHFLGLPYILAWHLVYVGACVLFAAAIWPLVRNKWVLLCAYLFLLFCPVAFSGQLTRLYRDVGYYAVAFICISSALGLLARAGHPKGARFFACAAGLSLAFAIFFREDFQWLLVYTAACVLVFAAVRFKGPGRTNVKQSIVSLAMVILCAMIPLLAISGVNYAYYGVFTIDDYNSGPYARAYGALSRVNNPGDDPGITIPKAQREILYALSPAFAELEPLLEDESSPYYQWVVEQGEYRTGYFSFVLRDAAATLGHYESAAGANAYYTRLAGEVNAACDSGAIAAGPRRAGIAPRFYPWMAGPVVRATGSEIASVLTCRGISPVSGQTNQDDAYLLVYEDFVHGTIAADRDYSNGETIANYHLKGFDLLMHKISGAIVTAYRLLLPALFIIGLCVFAAFAITGIYRKQRQFEMWALWLASGSLLCAFFLRSAMLAYVSVGAFPTLGTPSYEAASYPVALAFIATAFLLLEQLAAPILKRLPASSGARRKKPPHPSISGPPS